MRRLVILALLMAVAGAATGVQSPAEGSAGPGGKIYWADLSAAAIRRANLDGSGLEGLVAATNPRGIALDVGAGKMYWTSYGKIERANLDGSAAEDLLTGLESPNAIALDVSGGKMYWTGYDKIQRANLDGSGTEDLVTGLAYHPGDIALDVSGGKMYWTSANKIERANLDGSGVEGADVDGPLGIALDVAGSKIYWTEVRWSEFVEWIRISRANLDGSGYELILEDTAVVCCATGGSIALDVSGGKMYWTSGVDLMPGPSSIKRANIDGSGVETVLSFSLSTDGMPMRIALDVSLPPLPSTPTACPPEGCPTTTATLPSPVETPTGTPSGSPAGVVAPDTGAGGTADGPSGPLVWALLAGAAGAIAVGGAGWYARGRAR